MRVLAIIPARGGSKGIPNKNIINLHDKPLIRYTIDSATNSKFIDRTIVSTDSEKIAEIAKQLGAEIPFLRPDDLATDTTPAYPVIEHAIKSLEQEGFVPDLVIFLQPTSPLRTSEHIDQALALSKENNFSDVVSVVKVPHNCNPVSIMNIEGDHLQPYLQNNKGEILRRQDKPVVYARNGPSILILNVKNFLNRTELYGKETMPFEMSTLDSYDIDEPEDLKIIEAIMMLEK
jgi:CMP-N-acetylneuraminic acid synthetase